jgi:hypothetical protein
MNAEGDNSTPGATNGERSLRRRQVTFRLVLALLLVAAVVAGAHVASRIRQDTLDARQRQYAASLSDLLKRGQIERAANLLRWLYKNDPPVMATADIAALKASLGKALADEPRRRSAFADAVGRALPEPAADPNWNAVDQARKLARTDEERLELLRLENAIAQQDLTRQDDRARSFEARLGALREQFSAVRTGQAAEDPVAFARTLADLGRTLDSLQAEGDIDPRRKAPLASLAAKVHGWRVELWVVCLKAEIDSPAGVFPGLRDYLRSPGQLCETLEAFAARHPDSPKSADFRRAARQRPLWQAVHDGLNVVRPWVDEWQPRSPGESDRRLVVLQSYLQSQAGSPLTEVLTAYRDLLERTNGSPETAPATSAAPGEGEFETLRGLCDKTAGQGMMIRANGQWRVLLADPPGPESRAVHAVFGPSGGPARLRVIGLLAGGQMRIGLPEADSLPEGTMVLLRQGGSL